MKIEKRFAEKGYRAVSLDDTRLLYSLEFYPCNYRSCWEPAIKKVGEDYLCEKHAKKESKNG